VVMRRDYDLNSSQTIPSTIVDLVCAGHNLAPFDQGRKIRIRNATVNVKKITIVDAQLVGHQRPMNFHRQAKWQIDECHFTKSFVTQAQYEFGDTSTTITYPSLDEFDYIVLREPFWCYDDMEESFPILSFFGDIYRKLFKVERISNYIVWNYSLKRLQLKTSMIADAVCLGDIDCTSMSNLAEFLRARSKRHMSKDAVQELVKEHFPC